MGKAFTLLETLVVVTVIGFLATVSTVALQTFRQRAADVKRLFDIRQTQNALERYFNDYELYPLDSQMVFGQPLLSPDGAATYMKSLPINPQPKSSLCSATEYLYRQSANGKSYVLNYCLAGAVGELAAGACVALPGLSCVQNDVCSCDDISQPCCGYCAVGSRCGGGRLAVKNFSVSSTQKVDLIHQIAAVVNQPFASNNGFDEPADSDADGLLNTQNLINDTQTVNPAAAYCHDLNEQGFNDWYLPAQNELLAVGLFLPTNGVDCHSSSENNINQNKAVYRDNNTIQINAVEKTDSKTVLCFRRS